MLMPSGPVEMLLGAFVDECVSIHAVMDASDYFDVSIEAAGMRMARLVRRPTAMVVLSPKLKPAERRRVGRAGTEPTIPGLEPPPPAPKLRVDYAVTGPDFAKFIPRDKSVADDCPLAAIDSSTTVTFTGWTGLFDGDVHVSARRLPYRVNGTLVERVIAMFTAV